MARGPALGRVWVNPNRPVLPRFGQQGEIAPGGVERKLIKDGGLVNWIKKSIDTLKIRLH